MRNAVARLTLAYFGLVFATGFVFGIVRVSWLGPRVGERAAELIETPFMLAAVVFWARLATGRFGRGLSGAALLAAGVLALGLMLLAEAGVVLGLQEGGLGEYIAGRDPLSGAVYLASLVLFALMPRLVGKRRAPKPD